MTRVAVLDDWQGIAESITDWTEVRSQAEVVFFHDACASADELVRRLEGFQVAVAMRERSRFSEQVVDRLSDLKLLVFTGASNAAIDIPACTAKGILLSNTMGRRKSNATAELTLGLMIAAARHIALADREIRSGRFQAHVPPGSGLLGKTLGIVGLGNIGGTLASYGKALGMNVIAWSQNLTEERALEVGVERVSKDELFSRSDVVTVHLKLSERSRGIVGGAEIVRMKEGAILVNTSRGPLIEEQALLEALHARRIFAALDVYDAEPIAADHPLLAAPNTVLTPHIGYVSADSMADMYSECVEDILAWLRGNPVRVVNPEIIATGRSK
jgi:phosphoglycerate dehydrogenase-like enzyme